MNIIRNILLVSCLSVVAIVADGQDLKYDIVKGNKSLGYLYVSRNPNVLGFDIDIESKLQFWFFGTRHVVYSITNNYINKCLISAFSKSTLNDKTKHETSIVDEKYRYKFCDVYENETSYCDTSRIKYTVGYMYFKEPVHTNKVYSERYLRYLEIMKIEPHRYMITLPNGTKNYFTYVNGIPTEVEVNHILAKFYFKRME